MIVVKRMDWRWELLFSPGYVIPPEKVHKRLFVGSQKIFKKPKYPAVLRYNQKRTPDQVENMLEKLVGKERKLRKRLAAHGVDYDFPGFVRLFALIRIPCGASRACDNCLCPVFLQAAKMPPKKKAGGAMDVSTCSEVSLVEFLSGTGWKWSLLLQWVGIRQLCPQRCGAFSLLPVSLSVCVIKPMYQQQGHTKTCRLGSGWESGF